MKLNKLFTIVHATRLAAAVLRFWMCHMSGGMSSKIVRGAVIAIPMPAGISVSVVGSGLMGMPPVGAEVLFILSTCARKDNETVEKGVRVRSLYVTIEKIYI